MSLRRASVRLAPTMGSRRRSRAQLLLLAWMALLSCASDLDATAPTPPDTEAIRALPGYRAGYFSFSAVGTRSWVVEAGPEDARPVLLVHGISRHGAHDFDGLVPMLAADRRVITLDLPGFGRSDRGGAIPGPSEYADIVDELIAARVSGAFDIVAHSMGVSVALEVAGRHPDRVGRLVLADAAALLHGHALSIVGMRRGQKMLGPLGKLLDPLRQGAYDVMGWVPDHLVHRFAIALNDETANEAAARLMAHDSGAAIDRVRAPALILWGDDDEVVSRRGAWALASRLPGARLEFIPGAGHTPMRDAPKTFNRLTEKWLRGLGDVTAAPALGAAGPLPDGLCKGVRGRFEFSGDYERIEIDRCGDVVMRDVRTKEIEIVHSEVVAEGLEVSGAEVGLVLWGSRLEMSGGEIVADVGFRMSQSELDLAGVTVRARRASVEAIGTAKVLCSLCRLESDRVQRRLHGFRTLQPTDRF